MGIGSGRMVYRERTSGVLHKGSTAGLLEEVISIVKGGSGNNYFLFTTDYAYYPYNVTSLTEQNLRSTFQDPTIPF